MSISPRTLSLLRALGLSQNASRVYLMLLADGVSGVSRIEEKTHLHRPSVYQAVRELLADGLLGTHIRGKRKFYVAKDPKRLESRFLALSNAFDEEMETLKQIEAPSSSDRPSVQYLEGKDGITEVHDDIMRTIKKDDTYYRYSSSSEERLHRTYKVLSRFYYRERERKAPNRFVITNEPYRRLKKVRLGREIKTIPKGFDLFEYNISQVIYGNKVAIIDYNTETAMIIENAQIAEFQKKIFQLLYKML